MRTPAPALTTGTRSVAFLFENVHLTWQSVGTGPPGGTFASVRQPSSVDHAAPASTKPNSSVGMKPLDRPNFLLPNRGTRPSALPTAIFEPMRRSKTGQ